MPNNPFEASRISEGTLVANDAHAGAVIHESNAISRDDVRDGFLVTDVLDLQPLRISTLKGYKVRNGPGEYLGTIEDFVLDPQPGRVVYAALSFGGILGVGDKLFAVPWGALRINGETQEFVLDTERELLEKAPGFDKDNWPAAPDPLFDHAIHEYYER